MRSVRLASLVSIALAGAAFAAAPSQAQPQRVPGAATASAAAATPGFQAQAADAGVSGLFVPVRPVRIWDSGATPSVGQAPVAVQIAGNAGVPADATAVAVNTEVYAPTAASYVRVTPYQQDAGVAVQQFAAGEAVSNLVIVKLNQGKIQVSVHDGRARILMDLSGYFTDTPTDGASTFVPLPTARVFDSGVTPSVSANPVVVQMAGNAGVPADATAVVVNTEVYAPSNDSYVRVVPYLQNGQVALQEFTAGQAVSNLAVVALKQGKIQVKIHRGVARILMDVSGYFTADTSQGSGFSPLPTTRVWDSGVTPSVGADPWQVRIAGRNGVPADASAVVVNTEVFAPSAAGYLRVTPYAQDAHVAVQEFTAGEAVSNLVVVKLNQGSIQVKISAGAARILMDVSGYFAGPPSSSPPFRSAASPGPCGR